MSQINFNTGSLIISPAGSKGLALTAAAAGSYFSPLQENLFRSGLKLVIDITAISGTTPTLTATIQGYDPVSGKFYTILASAALNAPGTTVLTVYPSVVAATNLFANDILPKNWRVQAAVGGSNVNLTATLAASVVI